MGFLDSLEKLITEHGSATILKERIQLLNDRHADLQRKCDAAEKERDSLRADNASLRSEKQAMQAQIDEIRRLQDDADRQRQKDCAGPDRLPADRESVLRAICFHPDRETAQVAGITGLSGQMAQWHIDALEKSRLIHVSYTVSTPWDKGGRFLTVTEDGRDYLARNGLLQD